MASMFTKFLFVPYIFVLLNWAAVAGLYQFARGSTGIWNPAQTRSR
jgi:hypothetical protein